MPVHVVLVRHCEPAVDSLTPPATWGLTAYGARQARSLERLIPHPTTVVAGDEPKMVQSLMPLADAANVSVQAVPELRESHSEGWFGDEEFLGAVRRFLEEPASPPASGWETADAAAGRFIGKLREITSDLPSGATAVLCSGGRVLTAVLHELDLVRAEQVFSVWRGIQMPDVAELMWTDEEPVLRSTFGSTTLDLG